MRERVRFRFEMEQTGNGGVEHDFKWRTERTDGENGKEKGAPDRQTPNTYNAILLYNYN